jgi:hypothetical protein
MAKMGLKEAEMGSKKVAHTDEFTQIISRVSHVIGHDIQASGAVSTHAFSKTTPQRSNHAKELRNGSSSATFEPVCGDTPTFRQNHPETWRKSPSSSPRLWNETLAFAADG